MLNSFTIDVEDWFHILNSHAAPHVKLWDSLESRVETNLRCLLEMLDTSNIRATFFWLGWLADRHRSLVRECCDAGHEIASHGYHHVLPDKVGAELFKDDIERAKKTLEDITGKQVLGFRVAGFGIRKRTRWAFDVIKEAGYEYDSSVFPAMHEHNCMLATSIGPHMIQTEAGPLIEIPVSAAKVFGLRLYFFGGGYLRLSPLRLIQWGINNLQQAGQPLIVYIHPREVDPEQPRLPLSAIRRFRCYVNLKTTLPKLRWLLKKYEFVPMRELAKLAEQNTLDLYSKTKNSIRIEHKQHPAPPNPKISEISNSKTVDVQKGCRNDSKNRKTR